MERFNKQVSVKEARRAKLDERKVVVFDEMKELERIGIEAQEVERQDKVMLMARNSTAGCNIPLPPQL